MNNPIGTHFFLNPHPVQRFEVPEYRSSAFQRIKDLFRKNKKRNELFATQFSFIVKQHDPCMNNPIVFTDELRIMIGIGVQCLAETLEIQFIESLAECIASLCGDQLIVLCITRNKVRMVCGWTYEK